jgi:N-methylhydantoinase B
MKSAQTIPEAPDLDPIALDILWTRLNAMVNEQAAALQRTAFSPIVRDAGDCSVGVFDIRGRIIAQALTGTPGHILALPACIKSFLAVHPIQTLSPGDVLIGNNAYVNCGHQYDITIATPVFRGHQAVAIYAGTVHVLDIGGRPMSAEAKDNFEEGLIIPALKLYRAGEVNQDLVDLIIANVRAPVEVMGDISAVVGTNEVGAQHLIAYLDELGITSIGPFADAVILRSERAMRAAIAAVPDGTYTHEVWCDGVDEPLRLAASIEVRGDDLKVDYSGTSDASPHGINVVLNYTSAYTCYAIKCALSADTPNNEGSFRPISVSAPEGSLLNARQPAPVAMRHVIGHFLPDVIFGALAKAVPKQVLAEGAAAVWYTLLSGTRDDDGSQYLMSWVSAGGMGARATKDGLTTTAFPSGTTTVPTEIIENVASIVVRSREIRPDSGGPGRYRGGCGQTMIIDVLGGGSTTFSSSTERLSHPAVGFAEGRSGAPGALNGSSPLRPKSTNILKKGDWIRLELPGGGGFGHPWERDPERVRQDVIDGYVTLDAARADYGVALDSESLAIIPHETKLLRGRVSGGVSPVESGT